MELYENLNLKDLEGEVWKEINGYEGLYWVSNMGRIKSLRVSVLRIKKQRLNKGGYLVVCFCVNYKSRGFLVHRIVASNFIGDYTEEFNHTNHKNCIRTDNRDCNLEICSRSYNNKYAYDYGFKRPVMMMGVDNPNSTIVIQIDLIGNYIGEFETIKDACKKIKLKGGFRIYKIGDIICANKGFIFMLKDEYEKIKDSNGYINLPQFRTYKTDRRTRIDTKELRKIVQLNDNGDLIEIFDSFKLAENKIGKKGILDVCRNRRRIDANGHSHQHIKCGGFKWMYYEDYLKFNEQTKQFLLFEKVMNEK